MKTIRNAFLAVAMVGTLLMVPSTASAQQGDMARGAKAYGITCGRCHNPRSPVERSDRDWIVIMNHMRLRAGLTGQQVRDILAFLQATNQVEEALVLAGGGLIGTAKPAEPAEAAEPAEVLVSTDPEVIARGQALTTEKGCIGCHIIAGGGGQIGPDLDGVVATKGAEFVRHKVLDPTFDNVTTLMPNLNLSEEQIAAVIAYLATLRFEQ